MSAPSEQLRSDVARDPTVRSATVLGLGNVLMGDDGLGPYVARMLEAEWTFPPSVQVIDGGTAGLDLMLCVQDADVLLVIDSVAEVGPPGQVVVYRRDELLKDPVGQQINPHDTGLREALLTTEFASGAPYEVTLYGVIPVRMDAGAGLSRPVRAAVPQVKRLVIDELHRLGLHPSRRTPPATPDIWWER